MHPINIELTDHVCLRYIERFNQNLAAISDVNERLKRAKIAIHSIIQAAHYVSDNGTGILLHSPIHICNLIIKDKKLITLYKPDKNNKIQSREKKYNNADAVTLSLSKSGRGLRRA